MKKLYKSIVALIFCMGMLSFQPLLARDVGKVDFPISCKKSSQKQFNDALALVHNMMYVQAEDAFKQILNKDPNCGMAYWGIALTQVHPLWPGTPSEKSLEVGSDAIQKAKKNITTDKREKAYIEALNGFYNDWQKKTYRQQLVAWENAQYKLHQLYPKDADATALYALTHLAIASKEDKSFAYQKRAGDMLEKLHANYPMHPAGYHYTIHAYDNAVLAPKAEDIARGYDKIAPDVPHALHMPTHIFVRLGLWPETIAWNIRSAKAAEKQSLKGGMMSMHYIHAMDYLMYAYLQQAQFQKAKSVLEKVNAIDRYQDSFATAYGIASLRARYYLEKHLWKEAMNLPSSKPKSFPWKKYPAVEGITYFAQGLGAARVGNTEKATMAVKKLADIANILRRDNDAYWLVLTESKRNSIQAWIDFDKGDKGKALKLMNKAADLEESVDKHPVTPGEVMPATELLGDMYMAVNEPKKALHAFQRSLKTSPNRLNSLHGAAKAAAKLGDKKLANTFYQTLLRLTKSDNESLPMIKEAKDYLSNEPAAPN